MRVATHVHTVVTRLTMPEPALPLPPILLCDVVFEYRIHLCAGKYLDYRTTVDLKFLFIFKLKCTLSSVLRFMMTTYAAIKR
jgi:hypothetical protein